MAADKDYAFSSPFDAMLDRDRERLDRLYVGPASARARPAATQVSSPPARPPRAGIDPASILDDRFAGRWRHEVVERRRDGDHMVARCRLTVAGENIDLTRSGHARIEPTLVRPAIVASADGVPFSFRSDDVAGDDDAAEDAATRAAADALAKCVAAI